VADHLDESKAAAQPGSFELRRLVQEVSLGDQHQRKGRGKLRQDFAGGRKELNVFRQHLLGEVGQPTQIGSCNPAIGEIDGGFNQRQRETGYAIAVVLEIRKLRLIDARFEVFRTQQNAGVGQQRSKACAPLLITALVVPKSVVAIERDQVEASPRHGPLYRTRPFRRSAAGLRNHAVTRQTPGQ
jgi:hypothetical protein